MSGNSFGKLFTVTTFGESHGTALGCIVDGCPPGLELSEADLQGDLDRRRPGKSRHETQRREPDQVRILSGIFEEKPRAHPLVCLSKMLTSAPRTMAISLNSFARHMLIMLITTNMVSVIIGEAAALPPGKLPCGLPLVE